MRGAARGGVLPPEPGALAESAAEALRIPEPAPVVSGRELHRHPDRAGGPAHAEPVRALKRDSRRLRDDPDVSGRRAGAPWQCPDRSPRRRGTGLHGMDRLRDGVRTRESGLADLPELPLVGDEVAGYRLRAVPGRRLR